MQQEAAEKAEKKRIKAEAPFFTTVSPAQRIRADRLARKGAACSDVVLIRTYVVLQLCSKRLPRRLVQTEHQSR